MSAAGEARPVVVISHDIVGPRMAGPGLRAWHLARVLAQDLPVVLAAPSAGAGQGQLPGPFETVTFAQGDDPSLAALVGRARAVLVSAVFWSSVPALAAVNVPTIVDCYNPFLAEMMHLAPAAAAEQQGRLTRAYLAGDLFLCASERQRDWLLGLLEAHGRITPEVYAADPSLRSLVAVAAYGLPEAPPTKTRAVVRGVWPGIGPDDRVAVWGGGLWPWLDPLTAIRAAAQACARRPDLRLIFPGTRHPNPAMAAMPTHVAAARALAAELGVLDRHVFFGDWVPVADWPDVLLESDVALTLHGAETLESHLAFRSRVLDYVWAGLPIIATEGDVTSQLVADYGLGRVVGRGAVAEVAEALAGLERPALQPAFARARAALTWARAAAPVAAFCRAPRRAADQPAAGNVYYRSQLAQAQAHTAAAEATLASYGQMKYIRLVRWLHPYRQQLRRWLGRRD